VNSIMKRAANIAALATVIGVTSSLASTEHATFNLPVEAHWGSVILHPGTYTFDVPSATSWPQQINLNRNGSTVWILPITESSGWFASDRSYLKLVAVGSTYFVHEYDSGQTGKQFTFRVPKGASHDLKIKPLIKTIEVIGGSAK